MAERDIDLGWMRILVETVRRGSFSAAAAALGLTQPAVSYQIRRIEEQTGQSLVFRRRQGVELTPQGRKLHDIASRTVAEIDELMRDYRAGSRRPVLRLRTDYAFSAFWLMPRMPSFRALHPDVDIQIIATQRFDEEEMEPGDVAIAFGARSGFGEGAVNLLPECVVPICTPNYLSRNPEIGDAQSLAATRLIHLDAAKSSPWFDWETYLALTGAARREVPAGDLRFNTYNLVVQAVIEHQGVAIGWIGLIDSLLRAGVLVSIGMEAQSSQRGYFLVPPRVRNADSEHLVNWLLAEALNKAASF